MHLDETPLFAPLEGLAAGSPLVLDDAELAHLKVFRLNAGDTLDLVDGRGRSARARTLNAKRGELVLEEILADERVRPAEPALAIGALKGNALEEVLDHCAQMPLRALQPLWCGHGQRAKGADAAEGLEKRLRAKARVALKQSRRLWATEILPPKSLDEWLAGADARETVVLLDEEGERVPELPGAESGLWLLCGPEGGFSARELGLVGPRSVRLSLGPTRLRAKSAPIFALGALSAILAKSGANRR